MTLYRFPINGLNYHDFQGRLDELYELALGRRMSISIEHDNPSEPDAVIAYLGNNFVGYVRSGIDRKRACALIKASGRETLLGKVVGVDRMKRWLWLEVTSQCPEPPLAESTSTLLTDWSFEGELLPCDEAEQRLHAMLSNLEMTVDAGEAWDVDMEQWLEYIEQNLWRDISIESTRQVRRILDMLTATTDVLPLNQEKADRLQLAIDVMGSPEVRRLQAAQILQMASSKQMDRLLLCYGERAREAIGKLPETLVQMFREDGERFVGRLWYLHCPHRQTQAVKTLLAMMVRLEGEDKGSAPQGIPEQWLLNWGARQKDKAKADTVREIIGTYEMELTNPELARQIQQMTDACDTGRMQAEATIAQTQKLSEIASRPTNIISQLNMGDGTQLPSPDIPIPKQTEL